jgi:putative membrane protein
LTKLFVSWFINAVALAAAAWLVDGIRVADGQGWMAVALMALIFGLVNALIRPLVKLLTCLINIFTLGLFTLVINALMLWLSSWIAGQLGVGFSVDGFWPALLGSLIITIVSFFLSIVFRDPEDKKRQRERQRDRW